MIKNNILSIALIPILLTTYFQNNIKKQDHLSLEEKVGQLLIVHFNGESSNSEAKALIQDLHVGGFIYFNWANSLSSFDQVKALSQSLQEMALEKSPHLPLLIAIDQEGGIVNRLNNGFIHFPGNRALGMTNEPILAKEEAFAKGLELRSAGINLNFAPVVDINNNPKNPVIGIRAFGTEPEVVLKYASMALEGSRQAGIMTCLKHYPGHGDVEIDSHEDLPLLTKTLKELEEIELVPFKQLASSADTIMTAHIKALAFDSDHAITHSKTALEYLRDEIGFDGVIISDSLVMEGLLKNCPSVDEAAIMAFNAGCDILLLGGKQLNGTKEQFELSFEDIKRIHASLVNAFKTGRIPLNRLEQSIKRIIKLKDQLQPIEKGSFDQPQHLALAKKIADHAINLSINPAYAPNSHLNKQSIAVISPEMLKKAISESFLSTLGAENQLHCFQGFDLDDDEISRLQNATERTELLIICSYSEWRYPGQKKLIEKLLESGKPVALIALRDPFEKGSFSNAWIKIETYSPCPLSIQSAADAIRCFLYN